MNMQCAYCENKIIDGGGVTFTPAGCSEKIVCDIICMEAWKAENLPPLHMHRYHLIPQEHVDPHAIMR